MPVKASIALEPDAPASSTRGRILSAAERLFAERGYANVSMPAIAKASGITAGAIYRHFAGKEDLFFEAVAQRALQSTPVANGADDGAGGLTQVVADYTTHRLKLLRQLAVEVHAASVHNAKVRRLLNRSLAHNLEQIRTGIVAAQQTGTLDPSLDAEMLARTVLVFVMGLMHMETLLPQCVGDQMWHDFVRQRTAAMLGAVVSAT